MEQYPSQNINSSINHHSIQYTLSDSSNSLLDLLPSSNNSMLLDLEVPPTFTRLQSPNQGKVLASLQDKLQKENSMFDREICIEDICFDASREKQGEGEHSSHKTIKYSALVQGLEMLRCNYQLARAQPQQVINILDDLDSLYHEIVRFEDEVTKLFHKIKVDAHRHITDVKRSFSNDYFQHIKDKLHHDFNYANVRFALNEIDKFKTIQYPNLDYPIFKINNMKNRIGITNANNKVIGIESINSWVDRLYALDKKDKKVIINRSIASFLKKSPCEQPMFSYYLKGSEYSVTNGKRLKRLETINGNIPLAVVEKELVHSSEVRLKVANLGKKGMFIGFSPLALLERKHFQNCVEEEGSYYLTNRGDILPFESAKRNHASTRMSFTTNDEITVRREKNTVIWKRRRQDKSEQEVRINLSINEYSEPLYVCVHLEDKESALEILN